MRKFGKSIITFTIILSPILIMGRPIVGSIDEDYYSILGLNENSSLEEVYQAFYRLSEKFGPDVTNDPSAQMRFQKIKEAFDVLSDVVKRRQYDYQRRWGSYQPTMNFGFPTANIFTGDFPFGPQFADGRGGNAYVWTSGNMDGANNYAWSGANGWGINGINGNYGWNNGNNGAFAWGGQGGGNYGGSGGGTGSGSYGGSGGNTYGNGGSAWVVGGGDNGAAAWAVGGNGGAIVGGKGGAATVSGGGGGEATYESYTINGCTTVTRRMGDSVATYTTCE